MCARLDQILKLGNLLVLFKESLGSKHEQKGLEYSLVVLATWFTGSGFLMTFKPHVYVRLYRKIAIGEFRAQKASWESSILSGENRWVGLGLLIIGILLAYLVYRMSPFK